jgi:hypothetical protein
MYFSRLRAALLFYRYYALVPTLLWLPGIWLYRLDGLLVPLLFMKAAVNGLLWYFITATDDGAFYYYYNLHTPRALLFSVWFLLDIILFTCSLWLTALI